MAMRTPIESGVPDNRQYMRQFILGRPPGRLHEV